MQKFDLNIEKILENWEPKHAIREIIANALDEKKITNTKEIQIWKEKNSWHIKDFGRGMTIDSLVQNENQEKLQNSNLIGQFGIGLKDALATLNRHGIKINIKSKYLNLVKIELDKKIGFEGIQTLHAYLDGKEDKNFVGTEIILMKLEDKEIDEAKKFFLDFSEYKILEETKYGQVIQKRGKKCSIYINNVKVAEEDKFIFSYNITNLDKKIRKSLNRERTNIGRSAYSDRVQSILLNSLSEKVLSQLKLEFENFEDGSNKEELNWFEIQKFVIKLFDSTKYVFVSSKTYKSYSSQIKEICISLGKHLIQIPKKLEDFIQINEMLAHDGNNVSGMDNLLKEYDSKFEYKFVAFDKLNKKEQEIFLLADSIANLIGYPNYKEIVKDVKISLTITNLSFIETKGAWLPEKKIIVIKKTELKNLIAFAGTFAHELIHAVSSYPDNSREFENELTEKIGLVIKSFFAIQ